MSNTYRIAVSDSATGIDEMDFTAPAGLNWTQVAHMAAMNYITSFVVDRGLNPPVSMCIDVDGCGHVGVSIDDDDWSEELSFTVQEEKA